MLFDHDGLTLLGRLVWLSQPTPLPVRLVQQHDPNVLVAPLLTGGFVLIASLIAVASLYYSDTRKMRREDQRQWDAELRGNYVRIIESLEPLQKTLALLPASAGEADLVPVREGLWEAIAILRQTRLVLDITANRGVVEAVDKLQQKLASMWISAKTESDALEPTRSWGAHHHLELNSLMSGLRRAVRAELRVDRKGRQSRAAAMLAVSPRSRDL
ncbi:hypothetical protein [Curtobacterium sp. 20TX0008]|uniref:hypothetical protein n=1 Tax=Curtobacterium sp. 20TX0008 TaxID=3022018 RepID=UPI002330137F|nr:hypothetical protein [Curtobacterium sp. 20TX0008]MDB6425899.1 hypothetical protein [Curtobacterium sp. 20TX0008]